jgi:uncharacterized protein
MNILYLHGFNSAFSPTNEKVVELSKIGRVIPFSYDSFDDPAHIELAIIQKIEDVDPGFDEPWLLVGTSLGGYFALIVGQHLAFASVAINPTIDPRKRFLKLLDENPGGQFINYVTNKLGYLKQQYITEYEKPSSAANAYNVRPLIILDLGDEVLDSRETIDFFDEHQTLVFNGGSHRFDHIEEAAGVIREYATNSAVIS